jgi:hypothetical protein
MENNIFSTNALNIYNGLSWPVGQWITTLYYGGEQDLMFIGSRQILGYEPWRLIHLALACNLVGLIQQLR